MDEIKEYKIIYTDAATQDILEKTDYILYQLQDPINADHWYQGLKTSIQELATFPHRFQPYRVEPWYSKGYREMVTNSDVVLYTVDDHAAEVTIHLVVTSGRDIPTQLSSQDR